MATLDDVRRIALALPEATEDASGGTWRVKKKLFAWERPLRKSDLAALQSLDEPAPDGVILAVRVPDEAAKFALVNDDPEVYFTVPHFNGYNAVLVKLDNISVEELQEVVTEAWLLRAPPKLAADFRPR